MPDHEDLNRCHCTEPPFNYLDFDGRDLGTDAFGADIRLEQCNSCRRHWLVYLVEWSHYSKSGHWWRAPISSPLAVSLSVEEVKRFIESQEWCYVGGSYYEQGIHKVFHPITVF